MPMIEDTARVAEPDLRSLVARLSVDARARLMTRHDTGTPWGAPEIGLQPWTCATVRPAPAERPGRLSPAVRRAKTALGATLGSTDCCAASASWSATKRAVGACTPCSRPT